MGSWMPWKHMCLTNPGTRGAQEILKGQRVHLLATSTYHGECFFLRGKNTSLKNLSLEILKGQRVHMLVTVSCALVPGAHFQKKKSLWQPLQANIAAKVC